MSTLVITSGPTLAGLYSAMAIRDSDEHLQRVLKQPRYRVIHAQRTHAGVTFEVALPHSDTGVFYVSGLLMFTFESIAKKHLDQLAGPTEQMTQEIVRQLVAWAGVEADAAGVPAGRFVKTPPPAANG